MNLSSTIYDVAKQVTSMQTAPPRRKMFHSADNTGPDKTPSYYIFQWFWRDNACGWKDMLIMSLLQNVGEMS